MCPKRRECFTLLTVSSSALSAQVLVEADVLDGLHTLSSFPHQFPSTTPKLAVMCSG